MRMCIAASVTVLALMPSLAFGYLDAGSGSYIIQVALAMLLGAGFAVKAFWHKIVAGIRGHFGGKKKGNDEAGGTDQ